MLGGGDGGVPLVELGVGGGEVVVCLGGVGVKADGVLGGGCGGGVVGVLVLGEGEVDPEGGGWSGRVGEDLAGEAVVGGDGEGVVGGLEGGGDVAGGNLGFDELVALHGALGVEGDGGLELGDGFGWAAWSLSQRP